MSGRSTLTNFKKMLAEAKLPEKTVELCLRGDLVAEHERTEQALNVESQRNTNSLEGGRIGELAEKLVALEEQMREHTYTFLIRALPRRDFRQLLADHPPRQDGEGELDKRDATVGLNTATFFDAMIRACLVDPELDDETWTELENKLSDRQYESLSDAAWAVNQADVSIPFSPAASLINRSIATE